MRAVSARLTDPVDWVMRHVDWGREVLLALDAPLGWPAPMSAILSEHRPGKGIDVPPNSLFRRETDRVVAAALKKTPLDVGADRIARAAYGALRFLDEVRTRSGHSLPVIWKAGSSGVIEVYPAGTLKARGLPFGRYKRPEQEDARRGILNRLADLIALPDDQLLEQNADALDAAVCVLAGLDFLDGHCLPPPNDRAVRRHEGWIWVRDPGHQSATS